MKMKIEDTVVAAPCADAMADVLAVLCQGGFTLVTRFSKVSRIVRYAVRADATGELFGVDLRQSTVAAMHAAGYLAGDTREATITGAAHAAYAAWVQARPNLADVLAEALANCIFDVEDL